MKGLLLQNQHEFHDLDKTLRSLTSEQQEERFSYLIVSLKTMVDDQGFPIYLPQVDEICSLYRIKS